MKKNIKLFKVSNFNKKQKNLLEFYEKLLEYKIYKKFSLQKQKKKLLSKSFLQNSFHFKYKTAFSKMKNYTILALIKDDLGSASRLTSLFLRKGFKVLNLTFGKSEKQGYSRITIMIQEYPKNFNRFLFNLKNFIQICEVINITEVPSIEREILLLKVKNSIHNQEILLNLVNFYRFKVADIGEESLTMEISDIPERLDKFEFQFLKNFEVLQSIRSGKISLLPESMDIINKKDGNNLKVNMNPFKNDQIRLYFI
jgi:acetolactate synthase-1/3 small subunit